MPMQDIDDPIYSQAYEPKEPAEPCGFPAGSPQKLQAMADRFAHGEAIFCERDNRQVVSPS